MPDKAEPGYDYDLFISYATNADFRLARGIESFLESFHRLPNPGKVTLKELNICRDGSDFHAGGGAGQTQDTIIDYLARSRELLVLCSEKARASEWMDQEIRWFLKNRGENAIRVALTEGARLERLEQEIFPPALIEAQLHMKIAYDFRGFRGRRSRSWESVRLFDDERTRLAADLNGRPLGDVQPIWFGEQRRRTRIRTLTALGVAIAMLGLAIFGSWSPGTQVICGKGYINYNGAVVNSSEYAATIYNQLGKENEKGVYQTKGAYTMLMDLILAFRRSDDDVINYFLMNERDLDLSPEIGSRTSEQILRQILALPV